MTWDQSPISPALAEHAELADDQSIFAISGSLLPRTGAAAEGLGNCPVIRAMVSTEKFALSAMGKFALYALRTVKS